ncbi:MAG: hypothetical protein EPO10_09305 [Reyranella sp.]|jgi:putative SOS response-associated peptidase YedK|nr:MAG: hypothetical protein EPO10_09305 [Reyranella sp.]
MCNLYTARPRRSRQPEVGRHTVCSFLTTDLAGVVKPTHDKATPLILTTEQEIKIWLTGTAEDAL